MFRENSVYYQMFRAYDLRWTVPELNKEVYYWSGFALVQEILKKEGLPLQVCVMRDARETSFGFYNAFCRGLKDAGGEYISLGLGSTDMLYAATQLFDTAGAIVTASHNPVEYNGLKVVKRPPQTIGVGSGLEIVRDFVVEKMEQQQELNFESIEDNRVKRNELDQFFDSKIREIGCISEVEKKLQVQGEKLRIVVDTANGAAGVAIKRMEKLYKNVEFIPLYWELDGSFPNHPGDPTKQENLRDLVDMVKTEKADLGAALDGDGDRCVLVDEFGSVLIGDFLVAAMGRSLVAEAGNNPQSKFEPVIVFPVSNSRAISESVLEIAGGAIPTKQGNVAIKRKMAKHKAVYGGEASGHHYFGQFGCMDSGVLNLAMAIKMLVFDNKKASELTKEFETRYYLSGERNYKLPEGLNIDIIKERMKTSFFDGVINELDGILITYPDWRVSIRSSNTEPLIRINIECRENTESNNPDKRLNEVLKVIGLAK